MIKEKIKTNSQESKDEKLEKKQLEEYRKLKFRYTVLVNVGLILLFFLCILFLIRIKTHRISGQSMEPTFKDQDRIFVTKNQQPVRYDIVTFSPKDQEQASFVKRVVGIPGDTIWFEENKLFINHQMKEKTTSPVSDADKRAIDLPDGTIKVNVSVSVMNQLKGLERIPKNEYFLLGDNRNNSTDSRMLGLIKADQIEGVVSVRYYPFNKIGFVR
ncbi:signal peptidase I [Enterococcus sp. DIV0212c]|uniref:signal peptidase I n=1 Tax=Enterococcus sp. DIV0212c TaxID=2230867 RepID=UPI001A9B5C78|nr:signal peptidase I [Enterococcus sp. DIV0212c]MBO1354357.1 signal peptidase I [Enterococcus sp. DIV0212c]